MPKRVQPAVEAEGSESNLMQYSEQYTKHLPPGTVTDFKWKDYCPETFRCIQELHNIDPSDYMLSVCGDETLKKVTSLGKSGGLFLLSKDDRFLVKTLKKSEVKVLVEMLPKYYCHLKKYPGSLLSKLYGIHLVKPVGGLKIYFAVLSNLLPSDVFMHKCYDLKGSLQGRTADSLKVRERTVLKDMDLDFHFYVDPFTRHQLLLQIKYDSEFLEAESIMDYSLLIGMHVQASHGGSVGSSRGSSIMKEGSCHSSNRGSFDRSSSARRTFSNGSSNRGSIDRRNSSVKKSVSGESLQRNEEWEFTFGDLGLQSSSHSSKFGTKMQARAIPTRRSMIGSGSPQQRVEADNYQRMSRKSIGSGSPHLRSQEYHDVILYFGIVDFFQSYNVIKRIEHAYKSLQYDSKSISAVNPKAYSSRFQDFLGEVFQPWTETHKRIAYILGTNQ